MSKAEKGLFLESISNNVFAHYFSMKNFNGLYLNILNLHITAVFEFVTYFFAHKAVLKKVDFSCKC